MIRLFSLLFILASFSAIAQKSENTPEFTKIDVFGPFEVELIKSEKNEVQIDYRNFSKDNVIREISRGELKLKVRNKHYVDEWTSDYPRSRYMKVKIYYSELNEVKAQAGAIVFTKGTLKSKNLALHSGMGAELEMNILSKNLYVKVTMGGVAELEGQTENMEVKASMGGEMKASRLESRRTYVDASMGAEVRVWATEEIDVNAGFGADVSYIGGPSVRHSNKNFGAEVRGN
jgi:hypothetical protein